MKQDSLSLVVPADFSGFGLDSPLLQAISDLGFTQPTEIQAQTIPPLMAGQDVLGQAQTGTGKTAAFALPILNAIMVRHYFPQALILTPTRELAIQVSEAFVDFAKNLSGIKVLPVYGGAEMHAQVKALRAGIHIVVGTPGRIMDHMRRGSLKLDSLTCIVLDEADEMLKMGFQDDVEWILEQAPKQRQMALFSATIPTAIRQIARKFMNQPREITIQTRTTTAATIHQRYWIVAGVHKLDALSRILEAEDHDGVIVFVRTRAATSELAEKLQERGFNAAPLSGDISQNLREQTIDRLKSKKIDILVATDVAARGLDVDRISHVVNYDVPHDAEAYVHRVGRTGRAGRSGEAILFLSPRERYLLQGIEKTTRQKIEELQLPGIARINDQRVSAFKRRILERIVNGNEELYDRIVRELQHEHDVTASQIAAAAASLFQGEAPLLLPEKTISHSRRDEAFDPQPEVRKKKARKSVDGIRYQEFESASYRVEVGSSHGVKAGNLVGAITNEGGFDGKYVGKIVIRERFSTIDLPAGIPDEVIEELQLIQVAGKPLMLSLDSGPGRRYGGPKPAGFSRRNDRHKSSESRKPAKGGRLRAGRK